VNKSMVKVPPRRPAKASMKLLKDGKEAHQQSEKAEDTMNN